MYRDENCHCSEIMQYLVRNLTAIYSEGLSALNIKSFLRNFSLRRGTFLAAPCISQA